MGKIIINNSTYYKTATHEWTGLWERGLGGRRVLELVWRKITWNKKVVIITPKHSFVHVVLTGHFQLSPFPTPLKNTLK